MKDEYFMDHCPGFGGSCPQLFFSDKIGRWWEWSGAQINVTLALLPSFSALSSCVLVQLLHGHAIGFSFPG